MTIVKEYVRKDTRISVLLDGNAVILTAMTRCKDLEQALKLMDKLIISM